MTIYPVNMSSVSEVYFFRSICVKMCSSSKGRPFVTWWRLQILPKERRSSPSRSNSHKSIMLNGYLEVMLLVANTVQRRSSSLVFFLRRMQSNDVIPYNALIGDSSWRFELSQQSSGIVFFFFLPPSEDVRVALNLSRIANKQLSSCQPPNGRTFLSETHSSIRSINDVVERMLFLRRHSNFQTQPIFNY